MANVSLCPSVTDLRKLAAGDLPAPEMEPVLEHLESCQACLIKVKALPADDTLLDVLARARTVPDVDEKLVAQVIGRLAGLGGGQDQQAAVVSQSGTVTPAPEQTAEFQKDVNVQKNHPDPDVADTVAAEADEKAWSFLAPPVEADEIGRLGPYRVLKVLGAGGMGVVFRAEDPQLKRLVALKAMLPKIAGSGSAKKRFLREAQSAAAIKHDHIVTIHQVGEDRGAPYLAMEFLQGESLDDRLKREPRLPLADVLRIGREIAEGLAAAHEHGLVHRDIKPGNIWLEERGARGVERGARSAEREAPDKSAPRSALYPPLTPRTKILDFGLARATADDVQITQLGSILGTPAYMAPEQASGEKVDQRCDLFSLGCVLYRMSTGVLPFQGKNTMAILSALALDTPRSPHAIDPMLPPELSDLIMQMLAKKPDERPESAHAVAQRLHRLEAGNVAADFQSADPSATTRKATPADSKSAPTFRRRALIAAAAIVILVSLAYLSAPTIIRFAANKGKVVIEADKDVEVTLLQGGQKVKIHDTKTGRAFEINPGDYDLLIRELPEGLEFKAQSFSLRRGGSKVIDVRIELAKARPPGPPRNPNPSLLDRLDPAQIAPRNRFDWQPNELVAVLGDHCLHQGGSRCVAISPDGKILATGGSDHLIQILDAETLRVVQTLRGIKNPTGSMTFSLDGKVLFVADGLLVRAWDPTNGKELTPFRGHAGDVGVVGLSPNGRQILSCSYDKTARVWEVESRKEISRFEGHKAPVYHGAFSPDGRYGLSSGEDKRIRLWEIATAKEVQKFEGDIITYGVEFSPDGKLVLSGGPDRTWRLWDRTSGKELRKNKGHDGTLQAIAFSKDGRSFLTAAPGKGVAIWDTATGRDFRRFEDLAVGDGRSDAAFFPNKPCLVASSGSGVRIWDTKTGEELLRPVGHRNGVRAITFSPDGRYLASGDDDKAIFVWDLEKPNEPRSVEGCKGQVSGSLAFTPDGKLLLSGDSGDNTVRVIETANGREIQRYSRGHDFLLSPRGDKVISVLVRDSDPNPRQAILWNLRDGKVIHHLTKGHSPDTHFPAITADGRTALRGGMKGILELFDLETGKQRNEFVVPHECSTAVFVAGGRYAFSGSNDGSVVKLDLSKKGGDSRALPKWHQKAISCISVGAEDKLIATSGEDGRVIVWDVATGDKLREWAFPKPIRRVIFALDNRHLAIANGDGTIYILRLSPLPAAAAANEKRPAPKPAPVPAVEENPTIATGEPMGLGSLVLKPAKLPGAKSWTIETVGHRGRVNSVVFSPDGKWLASGGSDGCIRIWDPHSGTTGKLVKVLLEARNEVRDDGAGVTSLAWSPDSKKIAAFLQTANSWLSAATIRYLSALPTVKKKSAAYL